MLSLESEERLCSKKYTIGVVVNDTKKGKKLVESISKNHRSERVSLICKEDFCRLSLRNRLTFIIVNINEPKTYRGTIVNALYIDKNIDLSNSKVDVLKLLSGKENLEFDFIQYF